MKHCWLVAVAFVTVTAASLAQGIKTSLSDGFVDWSTHPAIQYRVRPPTDQVAELNRNILAGQVRLKRDGPSGYLRSVLDALRVPIDSQMMVFIPDSLQRSRISRENPRALYFNDVVSVGWCGVASSSSRRRIRARASSSTRWKSRASACRWTRCDSAVRRSRDEPTA